MINFERIVYLKFLTPVYIGGAQEKNLVEGLDYLTINGRDYQINERELFHPDNGIDPGELSGAFLSGYQNSVADIIKKHDRTLTRFVTPLKGTKGSVNEIKAFIKSGSTGQAYLPGSSIKGAIRSAIAHFLCGGFANSNPDQTFIKTFENSLFRYVKVSDSTTFPLVIFRSKIGTLAKRDTGFKLFWKESGKNNNANFNPDGFDTTFETPPINTLTQFHLKIGQSQFQQFKTRFTGMHPLSAAFLEHEDIVSHFFHAVNKTTNDFLTREINWFKSYPGDKSTMIVDQLAKLKVFASSDQFCLLHLGAGSGFHAMTGDWQFQDHTKTGVYTFGRHEGKPKYKTRRIAFDQFPRPNYFGPMGFVLLSLLPFSDQPAENDIPDEISPDQPRVVEIKPVHRKVTIKKGVILEGVVKEDNQVDVYMPDLTIKRVKLVAGKAENGKVIEVTLFPDGKGNFSQVSFKGFKK